MHLTAADLKEFYDTTEGRLVHRVIRQRLKHLWPSVKGQRVAGFGFTLPYLRGWIGEAEATVALMPSRNGAVYWPPETRGLVALTDEGQWPVETNSVDRMIIAHSLESYDTLQLALAEASRVLKAQGSLIVIVPNRAGLWARSDSTPFGYGNSYSFGQLRDVLKQHLFVVEQTDRALFFPPSSSRLVLSLAVIVERIGRRFFPALGGVNILEATKQLYSGTLVGAATVDAAARRRRFLTSPRPLSRLGTPETK